jgi:LmbE family N-acetylglucosaminyl deacetylase
VGDPRVIEPPDAASVMAVAAHPDDIEFFCAGTLARSIDAGATVRLLLLTSGDRGSSDTSAHPGEVAACREQEALDAARELGLADVAFLREPDCGVENTPRLRGLVVEWIRRWRPSLLFTFDPEHPSPPYISHPDHRATGRIALDAVFPLARDPLTYPEHLRFGLEPHKVEELWLFASQVADAHVDIAPTFDRKIKARLAHRSQTGDARKLRYGWRARAKEVGEPVGLGLAEAFTIVRLPR